MDKCKYKVDFIKVDKNKKCSIQILQVDFVTLLFDVVAKITVCEF